MSTHASAHVVTLLIIDRDELGAEEIANVLTYTRYPNRCISPSVFRIDTRDLGEWNDDHPLNQPDAIKAWQGLFPAFATYFEQSGDDIP